MCIVFVRTAAAKHTGAPLKCVLLSVFSTKLARRRVKCVCACVISPMEMNSKYMRELTALAPSLPPPLKPSMSEVFPGPRTNYLQPPVTPAAKVIIGVSLSRPGRSSSSATHSHGWKARLQTWVNWTRRAIWRFLLQRSIYKNHFIFLSYIIIFASHILPSSRSEGARETGVKQEIDVATLEHQGEERVIIKNIAYLREKISHFQCSSALSRSAQPCFV